MLLLGRLARCHVDRAAALRLIPGLQVAVDDEWAWLRCDSQNVEELRENDRAFRRIPGLRRYQVSEDSLREDLELVPTGLMVPRLRLPDLGWQEARDALPIQAPPSQPLSAPPAPATLRLESSTIERPACAWLGELDRLASWVECAPESRFRELQFAASSTGQVLVLGCPLPPLPGTPLWGQAKPPGPLLPCGLQPGLGLDFATFAELCSHHAQQQLIVFVSNEEIHRIHPEELLHLNRANLRATRSPR